MSFGKFLLVAMIRFSLITLLLAASPAQAQYFPCPSFTAGWTVSGPGPITSVGYDQQTQILSVVWYSTQPTQYYPVPISVIQAFNGSHNLLATFNAYVAPTYHPIWLQEKSNCPVLQDGGGYIWTE
jgi:hypothetical protein